MICLGPGEICRRAKPPSWRANVEDESNPGRSQPLAPAAGQAPNASGMVDQQALARQGQGGSGALQERLRRRGVVQEQKDFPGALPQLLEPFGVMM